MGFKCKKLVGYVRRDRVSRVKAYIEKYGPSVARVPLDDKGRTALHLACRHASVYTFAHLLRLAPNLMKTDCEGNLPLHWALAAARKKCHRHAYTDIVLPLLKLCRGAQDVPNKSGLTPRQILADLGLEESEETDDDDEEDVEQEISGGRPMRDNDDVDEDDNHADSIEENEWNDRLRQEFEDDCGDCWGRYEHDDDNDDAASVDPKETYTDWTDRMFSEYRAKHDGHHERRRPATRENSSSSWTKDDQRNFENKCLKEDAADGQRLTVLREVLARTKHKSLFNEKHARLCSGSDRHGIRLRDLPWSHITPSDEFVAVLLIDVDPSDLAAKKKCLREHQVQWHPDKFLQKFGGRLANEDREAVVSAVNHFVQIVNAAMDELTRAQQTNNND